MLAKIQKSDEANEEKTKELRGKIAALKQEISQKQQSMVEKKHAEKAHGQRFLDRQRLVRMEKKVSKSECNSKEEDLLRIALDQVYVAHHPNDVKYMPLFKHGKRVVDQSRQLFRRAVTRKRILSNIGKTTRVNWIGAQQYERLPKKEWTIQDEERVFGGSISRGNKDNTKSTKPEDSRFALASNHEALLKAAEQAETDLLMEENNEPVVENTNLVEKAQKVQAKKDSSRSSSSDSSSDSEDDDADPLTSKAPTKNTKKEQNDDDSSSSSDSDSSSSDDDSDDEADATTKPTVSKTTTSKDSDSGSSSSDSSSDSDSSDDEDETKPEAKPTAMEEDEEEEEVDDFLIDATDDNDDVFDKPAVSIPALSTVRGDKSKGFETQSQRPGEYRKKRIRRRY